MFTGIVEKLGIIKQIELKNDNLYFDIESAISHELKVDQSVAHNGICLTVTNIHENWHRVCAVAETIEKTSIGNWKKDQKINLERCMRLNDRLDGHIVQGHVDATGICISRLDASASWNFVFRFPIEFAHLIVEKGSICVNGTSLTCFNVTENTFEVAIIPYTFENTSIQEVQEQDVVNLEFDIIGKYVARMRSLA